ncbi:HAMP domain-containing sensor histidine kinase [Nonomuraea fuscirosea]|uniref:sensor histidine kinase n=1 Tax=Nonomuraea fuscirosea TaxID=1291556 RepID=UPI002DD9726D|nr:HAMP domain-containing sensor histidine kinase [Nonomuraea fuscirosea]WSA49150.1 HAMP domain-containing histidine kinase [Nonomuraea fuscirosea]
MIHTIRFRITVLYSGLLFVLAALVLGGIYFAVSKTTDQRPVTTEFAKTYSGNQYLGKREVVFVEEVENQVNVQTMATLRDYSLYTLAALYVASLGIGWVLAGRVLRPVRSITRTTEEIQATDLKRRIELDGPRDELKDLADTIDTMLDRLEEAFSAQRQLIDDASHELRSPLTIIRANVDAVLAAPDASEEERIRAVAIVDRATTRMTRLVEDLLATARRQGTAFADADLDLARVVGEACEEYATPAAERRIAIVRDLGSGLEMTGDADALRRAVANLLSNAVRLSPPGGTIRASAGRDEGWLWAAVGDDGPGLREADQARVFDRFWRGESSRRDRHTGLGLAIVRQIVESHGGRVAVFSRLGQGSTFVLWLPPPGGVPGTPPGHNPLADLLQNP